MLHAAVCAHARRSDGIDSSLQYARTHTHTLFYTVTFELVFIERGFEKMSPPGFCGGSLVAGGGLRVPYYRQTSV